MSLESNDCSPRRSFLDIFHERRETLQKPKLIFATQSQRLPSKYSGPRTGHCATANSCGCELTTTSGRVGTIGQCTIGRLPFDQRLDETADWREAQRYESFDRSSVLTLTLRINPTALDYWTTGADVIYSCARVDTWRWLRDWKFEQSTVYWKIHCAESSE